MTRYTYPLMLLHKEQRKLRKTVVLQVPASKVIFLSNYEQSKASTCRTTPFLMSELAAKPLVYSQRELLGVVEV